MSKPLTDRQMLILRVVALRSAAGRPTPTYRELGVLMCPETPVSTSVVRYHVYQLVDRGLLTHDEGAARSLCVTPRAAAEHPELVPAAAVSPLVEAVRAAVVAGEVVPPGILAAYEAVA